jgi:hypothetical protein
MKHISLLNKTDVNIAENVRTNLISDELPNIANNNNSIIDTLIAEGGESFYNYINWLGFANEPNLIVLSSLHHYCYDAKEMKNVNTIINLKELNRIKQIKSFLHSISYILPLKSNFIGCFVDNNKINGYPLRNSLPIIIIR